MCDHDNDNAQYEDSSKKSPGELNETLTLKFLAGLALNISHTSIVNVQAACDTPLPLNLRRETIKKFSKFHLNGWKQIFLLPKNLVWIQKNIY